MKGYSKKVMELFRNPKNMGKMRNADGIGRVGNPLCFPPNTILHINDSLLKISKIDTTDKVISHNGLYNKVIKIMKRKYKGNLIGIKNKLGITYLTPEHKVLAIKVPKTHWFLFNKNKKKLLSDWYCAKELEKNDIILYPILKEKKDKKFINFKQERKKWDYKSIKIPNKIPLNDRFLRFCGYYLAEGHLKEEITKTRLSLTFNIKEENLVKDVVRTSKNLFGIEPKIKIKKAENTIVVEINNVWIVRLFKSLFGSGANKKRIPKELMLLPPEKQESLIYGFWKGDGYFNKIKPRAGYSTISEELAQQIKILLLRQKIIPSIYTEEEKRRYGVFHRVSYRIHIGQRESLERLARILKIRFKPTKKILVQSWFNNGYLFTPITKTGRISYKGFVHNLEIKNSKSYLTKSLTVHNCGDLMTLYIKVKNNIITDIKVETFGCVAAIATSSVITEMAKGKTLEEAEKIDRKEVSKELGGLPPIKEHCSNLAAEALKKAIENYRKSHSS